MKSYDLYGLSGENLDSARSRIEKILGVEFTPHESSFIGDYYRVDFSNEIKIELRENVDPLDGDKAERDFADVSALIYVNEADNPDDIMRRLEQGIPEIRHLRRVTL